MIEALYVPAILLAVAISGAVIVAAELLRARPDRGRRKVMIGNAGATDGRCVTASVSTFPPVHRRRL